MKLETIKTIRFVYPETEKKDAAVIKEAILSCSEICSDHWSLATTQEVWVVLMTDWKMFLDMAAPPSWKPLIWFTKRFQAARFEQIWLVAGGWNQSFGKRVVAGVKPGHLIETADRHIGEKLFVPDTDLAEKVFTITCHELTHAFTDYLRLPVWLHEGLAMRTADLCLGRQTVQMETLSRLQNSTYGRITRYQLQDEEALIQLYVRSYWLIRWLENEQFETLHSWLHHPMKPTILEEALAKLVAVPVQQLWDRMDAFLASRF